MWLAELHFIAIDKLVNTMYKVDKTNLLIDIRELIDKEHLVNVDLRPLSYDFLNDFNSVFLSHIRFNVFYLIKIISILI